MNDQFANSLQTVTELKAKAEGLGIKVQDYQRLQYLAGISGTNMPALERVMSRLNLHAGEIQTNGTNTNAATRFLSQVWGGDGSNLSSDQKLNSFMKGIKELVDSGKRDEAIKVLNDVAPIAARDPSTQAFLMGLGLKNWHKAQDFKEVTSDKTINTIASDKNKEVYYGNQIGNTTRELDRVAVHNDALRENYVNTDFIEENVKDKLLSTASLVEATTRGVANTLKVGDDAMNTTKNIGEKVLKGIGDLITNLGKPDFWSTAFSSFKKDVSNNDNIWWMGTWDRLTTFFTTDHTQPPKL